MPCPQCQHLNPEGARFCNACGTPLDAVCPVCGQANPPGSRFCNACGQGLLAPASPPNQPTIPPTTPVDSPSAAPIPEAQRRQLTVMFCDLADSTRLSGQLDPEDLREVIRSYQQTCVEVTQRFGGYVARYMGDGLLVYVGYPQAHDDDAQKAVRTGLAMVAAMPELNARLSSRIRLVQRQPFQVRLGIHTGLVAIEEIGRGLSREHQALGETPNLAARLQSLAAPDTVVISAVTFELLRGAFACQDFGRHTVKGFAQPVQGNCSGWKAVPSLATLLVWYWRCESRLPQGSSI